MSKICLFKKWAMFVLYHLEQWLKQFDKYSEINIEIKETKISKYAMTYSTHQITKKKEKKTHTACHCMDTKSQCSYDHIYAI